MLSKFITKEDCAACGFCCSFRRCSLWETPVFTEENIEAIPQQDCLNTFVKDNIIYGTYDLSSKYLTSDSEEEVPCPFLNPNKGCTLNVQAKPWDCSIWPLRVMKKDNLTVIALTPTCPTMNKRDINDLREFVNNNLREQLIDYANKHPYLIKEYRDDFIII